MDSAAYRATGMAVDAAAQKAQRAAEGGSDSAASPEEKVTRKLDDDDVLIQQGGDYLIGKSLGSQVLIVRTGQKVDATAQGRRLAPGPFSLSPSARRLWPAGVFGLCEGSTREALPRRGSGARIRARNPRKRSRGQVQPRR